MMWPFNKKLNKQYNDDHGRQEKKYKWVKATPDLIDAAGTHTWYLPSSPYRLNGNQVLLHREGDWFILKVCFNHFHHPVGFDLQFTKEQLLKEDFQIKIEDK